MAAADWSLDALKEVIARHWGFRTFRPLQEQAMRAVLNDRDSLVVMPTGGGKSLCYQAPAVLRGDTTVVISPLIALMKDQVDSLRTCGVPAAQLDSSQTSNERSAYEMDVAQGAVRLLFVSPERLAMPGFQRFLQQIRVRSFAIDEAHCISLWGHDFRPEYRQLSCLKELFPEASVHAYTATATERVRRDVIAQLKLNKPDVIVGNFDRPNLTYRVLPRVDQMTQVCEVLDRHRGEAGIVYCLRRRDVDELALQLQTLGYKALPYHAGMSPELRRQSQDAFAAEQCDMIVATIAFGMGIDRSNLRFVLHATMPKSVEHYQQETGRAGRDGLEAECVLLHSGADFMSWKWMIEKSASEPGVDSGFLEAALSHLNDIDRYCRGAMCRHRALVQYFGQAYAGASCFACDICLGDCEPVPDAQIVAQKIISCVARVKENFGVNHVVGVLRGEDTQNVRKWEHEKLSTYGLLRDHTKADVRDWVYQLIGQEALQQFGDEYPVLKLNSTSWEVLKGSRPVRLVRPVRRKDDERPQKSKAEEISWEGVDRDLFDVLRDLRRKLAEEKSIPAYVVFHDNVLRDFARVRPATLNAMKLISGVGEKKIRDFGERFLNTINGFCLSHELVQDVRFAVPAPRQTSPKPQSRLNPQREMAMRMFKQGASVELVVEKTERSRGTVNEYLCEFIQEGKPRSIANWVDNATYERVAMWVKKIGAERLKPLFLLLDEKVPYDLIRLVVAHLQSQGIDIVAKTQKEREHDATSME